MTGRQKTQSLLSVFSCIHPCGGLRVCSEVFGWRPPDGAWRLPAGKGKCPGHHLHRWDWRHRNKAFWCSDWRYERVWLACRLGVCKRNKWHACVAFSSKILILNLLLFCFCRILSVKYLVSFISSAADREVQRILLELLNQMDGFDQNVNVKVSSARLSEEALNIPPVTAPSPLEYCRATSCPAFAVSNVNLLSLSRHWKGLSYQILPRKHMFSPTNDPWHLSKFVDKSY